MKAALRRTYGSEEVIRIEDIPITPLKPGEILVKVHATTVNRTDIGVLTGRPLIFRLFIGLRPKRKILGTDFAGIVAKTAGDVSEFAEGDAVFGFHDEGLQSQAEYVVMNEKGNIMPIPEGIDMATAAASLEGAHYALNFVNKVKLLPTDRILLNGATGAIGSAALQFLKANGHHVTAVANTKNMALIKSLGADKLYDYEKEDFTTDPDQYPFVFDAVGKSSFGKCKKLLTRRGVYISSELGPRAENPFLALWTPIKGGKRVIFPVPSDTRKSMEIISAHLKNGTFQPLIEKTYPFHEIAKAYRYTASGQKTGNVILDIAGAS